MYGKKEVYGDMYACACLSVNRATIRLWICVCASLLAWEARAMCAGEDICLWQKDLLKLNVPGKACEALSICKGEGTLSFGRRWT